MEQHFLSCQTHAACFHFKWTNSAKTHFVLHISRFAFQKFNQASLLARIFASALFQGPPWFPTFFSHLIANFEFQVIPCIHSSKVFQAYNDRNQSESFLLEFKIYRPCIFNSFITLQEFEFCVRSYQSLVQIFRFHLYRNSISIKHLIISKVFRWSKRKNGFNLTFYSSIF